MSKIQNPFNGIDVTPSDTVDIDPAGTTLYIGVSGNIKVTMMNGNDLTFVNHPVGYFPGVVKKVFATGTTATNIIALF